MPMPASFMNFSAAFFDFVAFAVADLITAICSSISVLVIVLIFLFKGTKLRHHDKVINRDLTENSCCFRLDYLLLTSLL